LIMISLFKKKAALLVFIFLIAIFLMAIIFANNDKSTGLLEAYNIAYSEVCKSSDHIELLLITSVDEPTSTPDDGKNGRRRYWNMIFADPTSSDKEFIVSIHDRTVKVVPIQSEIDRTQFINMNDLKLTSEKAVSMAINDYGLLPGQDCARGYHFVVHSFDNQIDFQVVGLGANNKMMRIAFDGSGNYLKTLMPHG
jgi:hypothetical protein